MTLNQLFLATLILSVLHACNFPPKTESTNQPSPKTEKEKADSLENASFETRWNYKKVKRSYLDSLKNDFCSAQDFEFIDIYPVVDSIASDEYENLILVDLLKDKGFKVIDWGRGNWMEGPRIVSFSMSNEHCECRVDKLYYSTGEKNQFKVTERIKCKKLEKYIFGNRFEIVGDFDGDGIQEKLREHYFDASTKMEVPKYIDDIDDAERTFMISPYSFMLADNNKIDTLRIASGSQVSGVLFIKNEGDLNGDKRDEISYVIHWADWSSWNKWHLITYKNDKWEELLTFPMSEWQLERLPPKTNSLIKKIGKNKIEITFRNKEGEEETKTVQLN